MNKADTKASHSNDPIIRPGSLRTELIERYKSNRARRRLKANVGYLAAILIMGTWAYLDLSKAPDNTSQYRPAPVTKKVEPVHKPHAIATIKPAITNAPKTKPEARKNVTSRSIDTKRIIPHKPEPVMARKPTPVKEKMSSPAIRTTQAEDKTRGLGKAESGSTRFDPPTAREFGNVDLRPSDLRNFTR